MAALGVAMTSLSQGCGQGGDVWTLLCLGGVGTLPSSVGLV